MKTEFEAKVIKIDKDEIRTKLKDLGASLVFKERLFSRYTFSNPDLDSKKSWLRLRDEGDKVTLALKCVSDKNSISGMSEVSVSVDNIENTLSLVKQLGYKQNSFQQNYREEWRLGDVVFDIDTWPMVDPFLEIEGPNQDSVKGYFQKLGFDFNNAVFGSSDIIYKDFYNIDILILPELKFS
jgi:adenylate cyclase class 2